MSERHATSTASGNPDRPYDVEDFLSGPGILMESLPAELVESAQSIIATDPPRHTRMRKLVSAAFTPKQMRRINDRIEANARKVVVLEDTPGDGQLDAARAACAACPTEALSLVED